ncbi:MAG TPA: hypothetical protein VFH56_04015 [Acidimicrobiales bacterium]|nr:hypothetical protein [Acidimicrobiales bacterium]
MSAEWADAAAPLTELLPDVPGAVGSVSLAVSGGRRQEAGFHWSYDAGKAKPGTAGIDGAADLVLLLAAPDAIDVLKGDVEPSVAFMRGRLKASGDGGLLLGFLKSTVDPAFSDWRDRVRALASETAG